ncbi:hypothetical protein G9P44_003319 [Scheffersomyces stipitis]|nr:hypothetical protein G9P44_003319 [Scheffersomyces stipitis]
MVNNSCNAYKLVNSLILESGVEATASSSSSSKGKEVYRNREIDIKDLRNDKHKYCDSAVPHEIILSLLCGRSGIRNYVPKAEAITSVEK